MSLDDLIPRREVPDDRPESILAGRVLTDPDGVEEDVRVRLDVDRDTFVTCSWSPRNDHWPQPGDSCLVAFGDGGRPAVVWWGPADEELEAVYSAGAIDDLLAGKSDTGHVHDDRYYTESEADTLLAGKSNTGHTHAESDVTGLVSDLAGKASATAFDNLAAIGAMVTQAGAAVIGSSGASVRGFGVTGLSPFGSLTTNPMWVINLSSTEWAVSGKTPKLSIQGTCETNATAPGSALDFTLGLYPISSVAGATGGLTYTQGTVVSGSTYTFNSGTALAASTRYAGGAGPFTFPSAGPYVIGLNQTGGAVASAAHLHFTARLFINYV